MKVLKQLIKLHKFLFAVAVLFTFLSIILNLCWNKFLAELLNLLFDADVDAFENKPGALFIMLPTGILIVLLHTLSEYLSSYLAFYTCEICAHEMRM